MHKQVHFVKNRKIETAIEKESKSIGERKQRERKREREREGEREKERGREAQCLAGDRSL